MFIFIFEHCYASNPVIDLHLCFQMYFLRASRKRNPTIPTTYFYFLKIPVLSSLSWETRLKGFAICAVLSLVTSMIVISVLIGFVLSRGGSNRRFWRHVHFGNCFRPFDVFPPLLEPFFLWVQWDRLKGCSMQNEESRLLFYWYLFWRYRVLLFSLLWPRAWYLWFFIA